MSNYCITTLYHRRKSPTFPVSHAKEPNYVPRVIVPYWINYRSNILPNSPVFLTGNEPCVPCVSLQKTPISVQTALTHVWFDCVSSGNGNYDPSLLFNQVQKYPMRDHNICALSMLVAYCEHATILLNESGENVVAVHCQVHTHIHAHTKIHTLNNIFEYYTSTSRFRWTNL